MAVLHQEFIEKLQINYIRASEPFSLNEMFELLTPPRVEENRPTFAGPVVLDLRLVHMDAIQEPEIRQHLMKKAAIGSERTDFPCAYLVKDLAGYSKVRLASIFADLSGVISEKNAFITEDLGEAIAWLTKVDADGLSDLVASLENQSSSSYMS